MTAKNISLAIEDLELLCLFLKADFPDNLAPGGYNMFHFIPGYPTAAKTSSFFLPQLCLLHTKAYKQKLPHSFPGVALKMWSWLL